MVVAETLLNRKRIEGWLSFLAAVETLRKTPWTSRKTRIAYKLPLATCDSSTE
jgi:hypothetical protein